MLKSALYSLLQNRIDTPIILFILPIDIGVTPIYTNYRENIIADFSEVINYGNNLSSSKAPGGNQQYKGRSLKNFIYQITIKFN